MLGGGYAGVIHMAGLVHRDLRDRGALDHVVRVAVGGQHHAQGGMVLIPRELGHAAVEDRVDAGGQVAGQLRQHDLGLRVAEASVELDDLRAVGGGDQARVQDAGERRAFGGHGLHGRAHDRLDGGVDHVLADLRHRAVGAHAAGVRALVVVIGALVVLGDRHRPEVGAVHEAHQRELLTLQEVLDHHLGAGRTETVIDEDVLQRVQRGGLVHRHRHALARRQAVRLDHNRRAMLAHVRLCRFELVEGAVLGGGDVVTRHQTLGEVLGALDLRGGLGRAERLDAGFLEIVDDALDQRHLGADEHPVVFVVLDEVDHRRVVRRVDPLGADAVELHARIAGGHSHLVDAAATQQRVGDGMFTGTRTDNQNLHSHTSSKKPRPVPRRPRFCALRRRCGRRARRCRRAAPSPRRRDRPPRPAPCPRPC